MDTLEDWLSFRQGENLPTPKLTCTECGGEAEGEVSWSDGSGEVCLKCHHAMLEADAHIEAHETSSGLHPL